MGNYSPPNNSIEHLEFTDITQTVSIADLELHQWRIDEITGYSTSNGTSFDDLTWEVTSKSFTYHSLFEYAVFRKVYYTTVTEDETDLIFGTAKNIPLLPPDYDVLYKSDVPDSSITVTFNIVGQQRTGTEQSTGDSGDGGGSGTTIVWSSWYDWADTYTITITTNIDRHCKLLQQAAQNGIFCKNSPLQPEW